MSAEPGGNQTHVLLLSVAIPSTPHPDFTAPLVGSKFKVAMVTHVCNPIRVITGDVG